ncbi:NADH dehydrogenase (ubiquinone) B14.7 subunit [Dermatophagoides farinae]|nr:uncharacterized protein LOC124498066 [Dermatophagoides farinae]KAH7643143.1 hypothetical protein HUG17_9834 [Dermatophagoides farinae]
MTISDIPDIRFDLHHAPFRRFIPHIQKEYIKDPENYDKKRDFLINYFYSKPDYAVPHEKLFYSTALGLKFGTAWGTFDVCAAEYGRWKPSILLFAKRASLVTASFATYGAVSNVVANIRGQKDDLFNHLIGGGSVGFIYGYLYKSSAYGSLAAAGVALIAMACKAFSRSDNYIIHPELDKFTERGSIWGNPDLRFYTHYPELKERKQHYLFDDV